MSKTEHSPTPDAFIPPAGSPRWFLDHLRQPGESHSVELAGRRIHCLSWNRDNKTLPVLMLVHGFCGHAHWWSFLAPFFVDRFRVVAIDLPGMGDSDPPVGYDDESFARAILAVIDGLALPSVTIVGHSFGGVQSIRAMATRPAAFTHGIVVDSNLRFPPEQPTRVIQARGRHTPRDSRMACAARFRLTPPQPNAVDALVAYIGFHSCIGDSHGWHWKFDPNIRNVGEINDPSILAAVPVPVDCIYGEQSLFNVDDKPRRILEQFGNPGERVIIPEAYHHLMVDKPLALVAALNRLLNTDRFRRGG